MENRSVQFPNRYKMVPVPGTKDIFDVLPVPGEVFAEGTPFAKNTVLADATAKLIGLSELATPNDAIVALKEMIDNTKNLANSKLKMEFGHYTGTGHYGVNDPNQLEFGVTPQIVIIAGYQAADGTFATLAPAPSNGFGVWNGAGTIFFNFGDEAERSVAGYMNLLHYKFIKNQLHWYIGFDNNDHYNAKGQLNQSDTIYYYFVFGVS